MTRDEAIARIKEGLGFRHGTSDDDRIKARLEEARKHLEQGKTFPWWMRVEDGPLPLAVGTNTVTIPTGFIRAASFSKISYINADSKRVWIPWRDYEDAARSYQSYFADMPLVASLRAADIYFHPEADVDYALLWTYYAHTARLDETNIDNHPWLVNCADAIVGEAGYRMALDLENEGAAKKFLEMRGKGQASYISEEIEREATEGPLIMGANL